MNETMKKLQEELTKIAEKPFIHTEARKAQLEKEIEELEIRVRKIKHNTKTN